jgi:CRP-like cAMP-binding protein
MSRTVPLTDFDCVSQIISQLRIFGGVTDAQWLTILGRLEIWPLAKGDYIFHKGDDPSAIYIVKSGRIDLQITECEVTIHKHQLCVGECFGEASFMSMHKHTSTAVAAVESEIIVLSRNALIQLRHEDIELFALLMMNLARELARRLYITDQMLLAATGKNASAA